MEIVIKISKKVYEKIQSKSAEIQAEGLVLENAVLNGTPLETAQWIKYGTPRCGEQHYKCTSCGYYINFGQWGELYTKEFKYCPNCRAKMKENKNDH